MNCDNYSINDRINDILDKISLSGLDSLSDLEKYFLKSFSFDNQDSIHNELLKKEEESIFYDDNNLFRFDFASIEKIDNEIHFIGTIHVPDLKVNSNRTIKGKLNGRIILYSNGFILPDFHFKSFDIFEFCSGLEYELDIFLDYVVSNLNRYI